MITKRVNRYYCEYCKKSGGSAYWIRKHETHCTLNPNRICRVCEVKQMSMQTLLNVIGDAKQYYTESWDGSFDSISWHSNRLNKMLPNLREITNDCPMCVFAALRQAGIPVPAVTDFDLKKEMDEIWTEKNNTEYRIGG